MKQILIAVFFFVIAEPCTAQWVTLNVNAEIEGFGTHDTSFFLSDANGLGRIGPHSWVEADSGLDVTQGPMTTFVSLGSNLFAGSYDANDNGVCSMSTNDGKSWKSLPAGGPVGTNGTYIFGDYAYRLARSTDSGKTWQHLSYPDGLGYIGTGKIVYMSTSSHYTPGIWRSMDSGYTWQQIQTPFSGNILMLGTLLFIYQPFDPTNIANGHNGMLIMSRDSGIHWDTVRVDSAGTPEFVNALATDGKDLFAGGYNAAIPRTHDYWTTGNGFYVSTDTGRHWHAANDGLGIITMEAIGYSPYDSMVYVSTEYNHQFPWATYSRPLRELIDTTKSGVRQVATSVAPDSLFIYPNPVTGIATISLTGIPFADVAIYDVLGREVASFRMSGTYEWNASQLPAGTYIVHVRSGSFDQVRRVSIER